jgi:hypothetical protein
LGEKFKDVGVPVCSSKKEGISLIKFENSGRLLTN